MSKVYLSRAYRMNRAIVVLRLCNYLDFGSECWYLKKLQLRCAAIQLDVIYFVFTRIHLKNSPSMSYIEGDKCLSLPICTLLRSIVPIFCTYGSEVSVWTKVRRKWSGITDIYATNRVSAERASPYRYGYHGYFKFKW